MDKMKFVASYSGGKDSTLAIHKMIEQGHELVALITTINPDLNRSWLHGIQEDCLQKLANSMGAKLLLCVSNSEQYNKNFDSCLEQAKALGATACVFGDIDLQDRKDWGVARCEANNLLPIYPLWHQDRREITDLFIDLGYKAVIKYVNPEFLDDSFLGKTLSHDLIDKIVATGADACGENGEYHTMVYRGPILKRAFNVNIPMEVYIGAYSHCSDIKLVEEKTMYRSPYESYSFLSEDKSRSVACDFEILSDEIVSKIGHLASKVSNKDILEQLHFVAELTYHLNPTLRTFLSATEEEFNQLKGYYEKMLALTKDRCDMFVLPFGCECATLSHIIRNNYKSLSRLVYDQERLRGEVNPRLHDFLGLLSNYFFYLSLRFNMLEGIDEIPFTTRNYKIKKRSDA